MCAVLSLLHDGQLLRSKVYAKSSEIDRLIAKSRDLLRRGLRPRVIYL